MVDPARPWMLALDTSNQLASIALAPVGEDTEKAGSEVTWYAGRQQTTTVLSEVDHLLRLANVEPGQLGAVAVATGPGAFNALRVGMSVAKGFAFSLGVPVFGVGTLDAAASAFAFAGNPVRAFVEVGRGRVVAGDYRPGPGGMVLRGALVNRTIDDLCDGLLEPTILAGELAEADIERITSLPNVIVPKPSERRRRAAVLLDLAANRWRDGTPDDLLALEPVYIHAQPSRAASSERNR